MTQTARNIDRSPVKALAGACLITLVSVVANAQPTSLGGPPPGPINIITYTQYQQLLQAGMQFFPTNPEMTVRADVDTFLKYLKDQAIVESYIDQHPNLSTLRELYAQPTNSTAQPAVDGNYLMPNPDVNGNSDIVETMGPAVQIADVVTSIQASSDPTQELMLYQSLYASYTTMYNQLCGAVTSSSITAVGNGGCANLIHPSSLVPPPTLANAALDSIKSALQTLAFQGPALYKIVPISAVPIIGCSAEIGANLTLTEVNYGDQTLRKCTAPAPNPMGILANFNWPYKDQLTCVKNQGSRGTCHIFAATSAIEQEIARDTGLHVNLSEQDFMENVKLNWTKFGQHFYGVDGGNVGDDLNQAAKNKYRFAYENQWDYNPSFSRVSTTNYYNSCLNYPYPPEPGCSNSTSQAPEYCYIQSFGWYCNYSTASLSSPRSPYTSNGAFSIWDYSHPDASVALIQMFLALNQPIVLGYTLGTLPLVDGGYIQNEPLSAGKNGGHVVHIVGYIDNSQLVANSGTSMAPPGAGGGYFIVKNSLGGVCAGDMGYRYMPVAYLESRANGVYVLE